MHEADERMLRAEHGLHAFLVGEESAESCLHESQCWRNASAMVTTMAMSICPKPTRSAILLNAA